MLSGMADDLTRSAEADLPAREQQVLRSGVLVNREAVALIEIPFEHELAQMEGGWRLAATSPGKLTVQLTNGHRQSFDLVAGDWLAASGMELYLSLAGKKLAGEEH